MQERIFGSPGSCSFPDSDAEQPNHEFRDADARIAQFDRVVDNFGSMADNARTVITQLRKIRPNTAIFPKHSYRVRLPSATCGKP
jgi:hypothetical protein